MSSKMRFAGAAVAASLLAGGLLFVTLDDEPEAVARPAAASPAPTVPVIEAAGRTLPETATYTGRLTAIEHVDLRARVGGYIKAVRFREGGLVKRGDVLFEIDDRPFGAALARAKAQLSQAHARRSLADRKATRARTLRADDVISPAELETAISEQAESTAAVEAARAWVRTASIDLGDSRVRAPIDGRIGEALVTKGNLVSGGTAAATLLATIVSVDPLHVEVDVDEATFRRLRSTVASKPSVVVMIGDDPDGRAATLDFVGNRVDPATGTARIRAILPNKNGDLTPGLFARVRIDTGAPRPVVLIRDEAIGTSAQGRYVLAVTSAGIVEARPVELGEIVDGLRVIRSGLSAGDNVILKGMARPGMTVTPEVVPMTGGAP